MPVDVLFFGAHPDDVEWGAGGMALLLGERNLSFAIVDLTRGEAGSRGTPEERAQEANDAAHFLGGAARENLSMPDGALEDTPATRQQIADVIRRHKPALVLAPYWKDRHPDHHAAGCMVRRSALYCTMVRSPSPHASHKPQAFLYYLLHGLASPTFVVDVSAVYQRKLELLRLHSSQFARTAAESGIIPQGSSNYLYGLESRDRFFGSLIGVPHGEGLLAEGPLGLDNLGLIMNLRTPTTWKAP